MRISNYRNSTPRAIMLAGLGVTAANVVDDIGRLGWPPSSERRSLKPMRTLAH